MRFLSSISARLLLLATFFAIPATYAQGLMFNPGSINFTNTAAGSVSAEQTIAVQFIPSPPAIMSLNVTSMGPPTNSAFNVTGNTCALGSYTPYITCEVKFTFTAPSTAGLVSGEYNFVTNDFGPLTIKLTGNSNGVPVVVAPTKPAPVPATGLLAIIFGGAAIGVAGAWARSRRRQ